MAEPITTGLSVFWSADNVLANVVLDAILRISVVVLAAIVCKKHKTGLHCIVPWKGL